MFCIFFTDFYPELLRTVYAVD